MHVPFPSAVTSDGAGVENCKPVFRFAVRKVSWHRRRGKKVSSPIFSGQRAENDYSARRSGSSLPKLFAWTGRGKGNKAAHLSSAMRWKNVPVT
jgi:hypothetical protein